MPAICERCLTAVVRAFAERILNIHPALLPKFGGEGMYGIHVHTAVLLAGETESGATVHLVNEEYDKGRILLQKKVPVLPGDTPEELAARVLVCEHALYPEALEKLLIRTATMMPDTLNISEIFHSIQGESSFAGWPCTFIRLAGCGHGCRNCDTAYAESEGACSTLRKSSGKRRVNSPYIEITGGEPLLQEPVYPLMEQLCDRGETVLLETGGFLSVAKVDHRVHKIIDLKPPSTGVSEKNNPENIALALRQESGAEGSFEFKIVVADRTDYLWARDSSGKPPCGMPAPS